MRRSSVRVRLLAPKFNRSFFRKGGFFVLFRPVKISVWSPWCLFGVYHLHFGAYRSKNKGASLASRERAHPLLLCLFSDRMQNILQRVGGGSVGRLDRVRVYLTGGRCVCMAEPLCDGLRIGSGRNQQGGVCMPLRYNYDKPEKPRRIKGIEVFSLLFSSFSKPKNHTEISRIAGGVSLTTNE